MSANAVSHSKKLACQKQAEQAKTSAKDSAATT